MTWLALRALLRRVPSIAWVIAFACVLLAGFGFFLYHAGATHERVALHQHALADSITKETIVHITAKAETDSTRAVAKFAKRQSDSSHARWQTARADVERYLDSLPKPVVDLIHIGDQMERRDAVTITAFVAVDSALVIERASGDRLDTLQTHQATIGVEPPKKHHGTLYAIGGVVLTIGGYALYHAIR